MVLDTYEELCSTYDYAVSASRALAHCREQLTEEQVAMLKGERTVYHTCPMCRYEDEIEDYLDAA